MKDFIKENPFDIVNTWINDRETIEDKSSGEYSTTPEKEKIRQERLEYFLPHLKEEFPLFKNKIRGTSWGRMLNDTGSITPFLILASIVVWQIYKHLYKLGTVKNIIEGFAPNNDWIILLAFLVELALPLLMGTLFLGFLFNAPFYRVSGRLLFLSSEKINRYCHPQFPYEDCPYIEAFMMANGFYFKTKSDYDLLEDNRNILLAYDSIGKMNFNQFIEFVKNNFESYYLNYDSLEAFDNAHFDCIFFYQNNQSLYDNKKSRSFIVTAMSTLYNKVYPNTGYSYSNSYSSYNTSSYQRTTTSYKKPNRNPNKSTFEQDVREAMKDSVKMEIARKFLDI